MQKHIAVNKVRDHQNSMIKEAKSIDAEIVRLGADSARLWIEIKRCTALIEKLDSMPNVHEL